MFAPLHLQRVPRRLLAQGVRAWPEERGGLFLWVLLCGAGSSGPTQVSFCHVHPLHTAGPYQGIRPHRPFYSFQGHSP